MNNRSCTLVASAFAALLFVPAPAAAFDLHAPIEAAKRLLGHSSPANAPAAGARPAPARGAGNTGPGISGAVAPGGGSSGPAGPGTSGPGKPAVAGPVTTKGASDSRAAAAPADADTANAALLDQIVLSPDPYHYDTAGRRDPFVSLVSDEPGGKGEGSPEDDEIYVRGILWGDNDRFALVETGSGTSYILRQGDRCGRYTVTRIRPDAIEVYMSQYGVGRSRTLPLTEQKGTKHDRADR